MPDPLSFLWWRFHYFFRDPERRAPAGPVIVSPADGYVVYVTGVAPGEPVHPVKSGVRVDPEELGDSVGWTREGGTLIGVYMTPLSVHFNRAPIGGRIARVAPRPALRENLSMARTLVRLIWNMPPYVKDSAYITENARNSIVIDGQFPVLVIQIADRYVSRVDCCVQEGGRVEIGHKIGMIRMGSQCDLFIPRRAGAEVLCRVRDKVVAGETVLARY